MKYAYEDLSDGQFENLVVYLCNRLFGVSVQGFSQGPDGGRGAKFIGTAELFPSQASPWIGTTIIQAKHTNGHNRTFSDPDFYSRKSASAVLVKEMPRIRTLRENRQLDNYILFSNRRLAANADSDIRNYIAKECDIQEGSIYLCGQEQMELWLKLFPDIPTMAHLDPIDSPLIVSPEDLAEVVDSLARMEGNVPPEFEHAPTLRVSYEQKNTINNMSADYARAIRRLYLKETKQIGSFLAAPSNLELLHKYESVVEEFQLKIIAYRKDYQEFDKVMEYLVDLLVNRDPILSRHRRLTRAMLFYMYWNCDIGETSDAPTV